MSYDLIGYYFVVVLAVLSGAGLLVMSPFVLKCAGLGGKWIIPTLDSVGEKEKDGGVVAFFAFVLVVSLGLLYPLDWNSVLWAVPLGLVVVWQWRPLTELLASEMEIAL